MLKLNSKKILICFIAFIGLISTAKSQNLIKVDWINILCEDYSVHYAKSIATDSLGNIYVLIAFNNTTNCHNEEYVGEEGAYLLFKLNQEGEIVWIKRLGGVDSFSGGELKINSEGEIIIGLPFKGIFYFEGLELENSAARSTIILTINKDGDVKWFKLLQSSQTAFLWTLHLDSSDNIYSIIYFLDSLLFDNHVLIQSGQGAGYDQCLIKLDSNGLTNWYHHFYSDNVAVLRELDYIDETSENVGRLIVTGNFFGDSLFVDNKFFSLKEGGSYERQRFIFLFNEDGEIMKFSLLDIDLINIEDLTHYGDKIYIIGLFKDTIEWQGYKTISSSMSSYLAELDCHLNITYVKDFYTFSKFNVTDLVIDKNYGFLISGVFSGELISELDSITLEDEFDDGTFITNLNSQLEQIEIAFIKGEEVKIRDIEVNKNGIVGLADYRRSFYFDEFDYETSRRGLFAFQINQLEKLSRFEPGNYHYPPRLDLPTVDSSQLVRIYPNPFVNEFSVEFYCGIEDIRIYDLNGRDITSSIRKQIGFNKVTFYADNLPSSEYFIFLEGSKKSYQVIRLNSK